MATKVKEPTAIIPRSSRSPRTHQTNFTSSASFDQPSTSNTPSAQYTSTSSYKHSSDAASISSRSSLSSLQKSLPDNPHIYDFREIASATNNFLSKRHTTSTPSWRCTLRGKDVIVFQRKFLRRIETSELRERLSTICRSHHTSLTKLLGASVSGEYNYMVYEFIDGANLSDCLRNPRNPNFTALSSWISRMQVATDIAHGLDYIHHKTGLSIRLVHKYIKSSSVMIIEPSFNAKICHFGAAQLCGEGDAFDDAEPLPTTKISEIEEVTTESSESKKVMGMKRTDSRRMQFEGVMGYMCPEFQSSGTATQKSDVYAFGVVILELLCGEEPLKYKFEKSKGEFLKKSVIESARFAIEEGRLRQWIDPKLNDSFPVEVAERLTRLALDCVNVNPDQRPDMGRVAGKISKLYLESRTWSDSISVPTGISVSLAPR